MASSDSDEPLRTKGRMQQGGLFDGEGWVSLRRLSLIADLSYPTLLKLVNRKALLAVRIGGNYRIYESEVRRFLREGNHPDAGPPIPTRSGFNPRQPRRSKS